MTEEAKTQLLKKEYETNKKSFADIAVEYETYSNKLRRDAIKYNIKIRNKSEAQSNALANGSSVHPTKGKNREPSTKEKIGLSVLKSWERLDDSELSARKDKSRKQWESLSEDKKADILKQANDAVRETSKVGSKLEKYLFNSLLKDGYKVEFHKEQNLLNTKLQIDLFLPDKNLAIEVDGPSHFAPVWGDDNLKKNKKYDNKKNGLILGKGLYLIRIQQTRDFSKSRALLIYQELKSILNDMTIIDNSKTVTIKD
jgi:hypothetical protein